MRTGIILFVVFVAVIALGALLWWRFKGNGRTMTASTVAVATRNHHSLPRFHYERAGTAPTQPVAAAPLTPGRALASLLPEKDFREQEAAELQVEADRVEAAQAECREPATEQATAEEVTPAENPTAETEAPKPGSSRHAAGAVASLLDTLDEAPAADPTPAPPVAEPTPEPDEEPAAPALYYNPITAPAPTANDQANRAAEIALRKQRRTSMAADTAAQRDALSGIFLGTAGKPIPAKSS